MAHSLGPAEIVILGSGAGFATADRFSTSIALLAGGQVYIFDCGEPCSALLFRHGIDPLAVRSIFISHMHADHVGGLGPLLFSMYLPGRAGDDKFRPWSVHPESQWYRDAITFPCQAGGARCPDEVGLWLPREAIEPMRAYLPAIYLAPSILPFDLNIQPVEQGACYSDELISVEALPNSHLSRNKAYHNLPTEYPGMSLESYSYGVTVGTHRVVYSGDVTSLQELDPLLGGADTIIVELAHFPPEDLVTFVGAVSATRIILTHVHPGLEERVAAVVKLIADSRVSIAYDGYRFPLA